MKSILFHSRSKSDIGRLLSNFYLCPIKHHDVTFSSVENAFQASKFLMSNKQEYFTHLCDVSPAEARKMGSKSGMNKVGAKLDISAWEKSKNILMESLIIQRFHSDSAFNMELSKLIKNNVHLYHFERSGAKSYWGGFFCKKDNVFKGQNRLGEILMKVHLHT